MGKGAKMRLSSTLCNPILKTSSDGDSTTSLERLLQWMALLTVRDFFLILSFTRFPLPSPYGFLWSESLCPLWNCPLEYCDGEYCDEILGWILGYCDEVPLSLLKRENIKPLFPYRAGFPGFVSLWPLWTLSSLSTCFFNCGIQNRTQYFKCGLTNTE